MTELLALSYTFYLVSMSQSLSMVWEVVLALISWEAALILEPFTKLMTPCFLFWAWTDDTGI